MRRLTRFGILTAAAVVSIAVCTARPVFADDTVPTLREAVASVSFDTPSDGSFLVAGLTPKAAAQQSQGRSGGSGHGGIGVGAKGGFLFNNFSEAHSSFKNNTGWLAGIFFGGNRPGVIGVMGEILYAKKGAKANGTDITTDLYYLEIPILLRINIGSSSLKGVSFYAIGGPSFDINLKAKQKDLDVKNNYESLDIGAIAGGGVEITRFLIEARYNWGLRNVLKTTDVSGVSDIKTRSFAVMIGLRFN